jgi:electron transfer flavoprotein alpha subunit
MPDILAFVEQREGRLRGVASEVVTAATSLAQDLGGEVHALVIGAPGLAESVAGLGANGAARIRVAEHDALGRYTPETFARVAAEAVRDGSYGVVLFPATAQGKDLAPRVAALLDVPLVGDATAFEWKDGALTVIRPIYAGKALARVAVNASPAVVSIRPNSFQPREAPSAGALDGYTPDVDAQGRGGRFVEFKEAGGGSLDVAEATVIVSGGRGMKGPENWHLLEALRDALGPGTAIGASRAVVDAGWRPHAEQVGQTGKTVSPKLYFAMGISGAIQHLAGMRTAGTIVAVNKDADAPIFGVADYGIVGDVFEVLPRLAEEIAALRSQN